MNPLSSQDGWVPGACTLPTAEQPPRIAEFDRLFAESVREITRSEPTGIRLTPDFDPAVATAARTATPDVS